MRKFVATLLCLSLFMTAMLNASAVSASLVVSGADAQQECSQQQTSGCPTDSVSDVHQLCANNCWVAQAAIIPPPLFSYLAVTVDAPQFIPFLFPGDYIEEPYRPPRRIVV